MKRLLIAGTAAAVLLLSACGANDERGRGDAGISHYDDGKAEVINMPDSYSNVATKCDGHGHRIFMTREAVPVTVIVDDSCPGGSRG